MTREEAIRCLSIHSSTNGSGLCTDKQHYEAKQMAIQALSQEPTVQDKQAESEKYQKAFDDGYANGYEQARFDYEQEPCDDAISRKDTEECKELMTDINGDTVYAVRMSDIRQLLSVTQKSVIEDAVSRARIIDELNRLGRNAFKDDTDYDNFFAFVDSLSSVNPQPSEYFIDGVHAVGYREGYKDAQKQKSGKWIEEVNDFGEIAKYHCSKCYEDTGFTTDCKWKYCPNCGIKMESEE